MNPNRRTFLKTISGFAAGVMAAFGGSKSKAKLIEMETAMQPCPDVIFSPMKPRECEPLLEVWFNGYRFRGVNNNVWWEMKNPKGGWSGTHIILPTLDKIKYFKTYEDKLFWVGERETWEIQHVGGEMVFQWTLSLNVSSLNLKTSRVCYCHKTKDRVSCNYPKCPDYNPGNKKPYKDEYE